MTLQQRAFCCVLGLVMASQPLLAHHGASEFALDKLVTLEGSIVRFELINPHTHIYISVNDETWSVETDNVNSLYRNGWRKDSLKPGTAVKIVGHPAKSGSKNLYLQKVVFPDGRELKPRAGYQ
jgi:hypothetical protein